MNVGYQLPTQEDPVTLYSRLISGLAPVLLMGSPLAAQGLAPAGDAEIPILRVTPAVVSVMAAPATVEAAPAIQVEVAARASRSEGTILMIVGGAAVVTGLIVDEEIIYIPGAIVGLYGLYRYLKSGG
jgi:hypothetical protein